MTLEFTLKSEFPHGKIHDIRYCSGCAIGETGEAFVFLESLISYRNISDIDLCECCWHCKNAKETIIKTADGDGHVYDCSLDHDNVIDIYIDEINKTTIHELIHLSGIHDEEQTKEAIYSITGSFTPCRYWKKNIEPSTDQRNDPTALENTSLRDR